jgi:hypothetical protein
MLSAGFSIKSACSDRELAFLEYQGDYFAVDLRGHAVSARRRVWTHIDIGLLVELFDEMAAHRDGWSDTLEWASLEGEMRLSAKCDRLGHVVLHVVLRDPSNGDEGWRVEAGITTELGQLPAIAEAARRFFL